MSGALLAALPAMLAESPDPDGALNLLERLSGSASPEVFRLFDRHHFLAHYAIVVFGFSQFLGETLLQNTDLLHLLARDKGLERSHSREDFQEAFARFRSRSFDTDVALLLSRFKRREYIRIMLRDVLRIATLAETTAEISALSDVLIEEALRESDAALRNRYGAPQHLDPDGRLVDTPFAVLSLGKLGGNELNYASDVDLLYLHGDGEREGAAISNREYFIRLAQQVTEILSRPTREGQVFRIDLRLRPQGREGEPAVALRQALRYYAGHAHDWELQALIKVRHSAGDITLAREFIRAVQPHVYRPELNLAAIETARESLEKMGTRKRRPMVRSREQSLDVKLDRGGIRDIEFLVQCLQRVYGGAEPWLRSGGTLFSLSKLHDKGHLAGRDFHQLSGGYELLRKLEHRLQLRRGQQTHRLPESPDDVTVLYRSVLDDPSGAYRPQDLVTTLRERMDATAGIYDRIIHSQRQQAQDRGEEFRLRPGPGESGREQSQADILQRLAVDSPALYELASRREIGTHTRRNLQRFLSSAFTSSDRYAAVLREPGAVERAIRLFSVSEFLTDILIRHPEEIATVAGLQPGPGGAGELFGPGSHVKAAEDAVLGYAGSDAMPHGERLALLRRQYRHRVFITGARDVMQPRSVYDSIAELTAAADDAIAAALRIAGAPPGFCVLALGRLGSEEFDIGSDADLLFLRDASADPGHAVRCAEQLVQALAAYTRDGIVFAVDPRLRPQGYEGELVITPSQLADYFSGPAQPWEALTYTKLRHVAGSEQIAHSAVTAVESSLPRFRTPGFRSAVREMRDKLARTDISEVNFKTAPGAFYDIDFIVCALLVEHGIEDTRGSIRERLYGLGERGLLSDADCATLDFAAELLRTVEHVVRLVQGRARKSLPVSEHAAHTVESVVSKVLDRPFPNGLARELEGTFTSVRQVYDRVLR